MRNLHHKRCLSLHYGLTRLLARMLRWIRVRWVRWVNASHGLGSTCTAQLQQFEINTYWMILTLPCHDGLQRLPWHPWSQTRNSRWRQIICSKAQVFSFPPSKGYQDITLPEPKPGHFIYFPTSQLPDLGRGAMLRPGLRTGSIWYPVRSNKMQQEFHTLLRKDWMYCKQM